MNSPREVELRITYLRKPYLIQWLVRLTYFFFQIISERSQHSESTCQNACSRSFPLSMFEITFLRCPVDHCMRTLSLSPKNCYLPICAFFFFYPPLFFPSIIVFPVVFRFSSISLSSHKPALPFAPRNLGPPILPSGLDRRHDRFPTG